MASPQLPLSPIDLIFLGKSAYSVEFLFVFDYALDVGRLQRSLAWTSRKFWPMRARLVPDSQYGMAFEGSEPIDFATVGDIETLDFDSPQALAHFHRPVHSVEGEPLTKVTYGRVGKGSALAINISHCVVDGYSFFLFAGTLAAHYRSGELSVANLIERIKLCGFRPDLDRRKLHPARINAGAAPTAEDVFRRTGIAWAGPRTSPSIEQASWRFEVFSDRRMKELLAEAGASTDARLSRHDVIAATLWQQTAKDWGFGTEELTCTSAFDYRRVNSDLNALYFGNAVRCAAARLSGEDLIAMPLGKVAAMIRHATAAIDDAAAKDSLMCMTQVRQAHGLGALQEMHVSHPRNGLLVTNLSRFPLGRFDFGGGPARRLIPLTSAPRSALLLAHPEGVVARLQQ